ncbi:M23 family metallopeptidase [uncultured Nocardioides sp.]|uniref:murein hydrolase activator EnvC family protein n=1 Tax=uncultured Nocardioides sp. TaxID=198441 RepID=UPI00268C32B1
MRTLVVLMALITALTVPAPAAAGPPDGPDVPHSLAGPGPGPGPGSRVGVAAVLAAEPVGVWPLRPQPAVVRGFDPPTDPWGAGHRGVDLAARPGQVVRVALPGTVTYAADLAGRGVVVVSHGATRTTYEPVEATVRAGEPVSGGEPIGTLQAGPSHCPPRSCLHWGWLEGTTYLDPLSLVGQGPVRLLPFLAEPPQTGGSSRPGPPVPSWW